MYGTGKDLTKELVEEEGKEKASHNGSPQPSCPAQDGTRREMLFLFKFLDACTGNFRKIFRLLFMKNVNHIIDGDQPHEVILFIYHRDTQQVIFGNDTCYFLLIGVGRDLNDVFIHQVFQTSGWFCYYELAQ